MRKIQPVILSGGSGTRLWPLSREAHPKQFINFKEDTLFGQTLDRAKSVNDCMHPIIVCNENHRFFVSGIMKEKGIHGSILLEPAPRNTAPAIALAALATLQNNEDPFLLVLPSDHIITPVKAFAKTVSKALGSAEKNMLFTFGITPVRPETGYGYIKVGAPLPDGGFAVQEFLEKPKLEQAKGFLNQGNYLWNGGIFLFKASVYLEELKKYAPKIYEQSRITWKNRQEKNYYTYFSKTDFLEVPSISIDYAVMEKTSKAGVIELSANWSDLGSWGSFYDGADKDDNANAITGDVVCRNAKNCYLHSSNRLLVGMNIENIAVIETADAVLVMDKSQTQDVKELLASLKKDKREEADTHLKVYRPWGNYEVLTKAEKFQVKRIFVDPSGVLSSQYHKHRTEHWVVVSGTAKVTNGDKVMTLKEDQSTYIPVGVVHRLENLGDMPLEIIEVQSGNYLGEDDIVRLEDFYGRI